MNWDMKKGLIHKGYKCKYLERQSIPHIICINERKRNILAKYTFNCITATILHIYIFTCLAEEFTYGHNGKSSGYRSVMVDQNSFITYFKVPTCNVLTIHLKIKNKIYHYNYRLSETVLPIATSILIKLFPHIQEKQSPNNHSVCSPS